MRNFSPFAVALQTSSQYSFLLRLRKSSGSWLVLVRKQSSEIPETSSSCCLECIYIRSYHIIYIALLVRFNLFLHGIRKKQNTILPTVVLTRMAFSTTANEVSVTTNDVETVMKETCDDQAVLKAHKDRYDGVVVDVENMQNDASLFAASLKASLSQWTRQGKKAVWIKVPKEQEKLVPVAIELGFWYHHAEPWYVMLVYWIPQTPCTIPANASHQVGIAAFVFNDDGQVLVVQEKCGPYKDSGLWKMPTGRINQGEGIKEGAIREVQEETGIDTEFVQVVGFRDGHNAPFGKSDMLFVCMLKSLSSNIVAQDTEVSAAKWMAIEEFASQPKNQQSKLLKDMIGACVGTVKGRCKGFSGTGISSNSRKPSAFYCGALDAE